VITHQHWVINHPITSLAVSCTALLVTVNRCTEQSVKPVKSIVRKLPVADHAERGLSPAAPLNDTHHAAACASLCCRHVTESLDVCARTVSWCALRCHEVDWCQDEPPGTRRPLPYCHLPAGWRSMLRTSGSCYRLWAWHFQVPSSKEG